MLGCFLRNGCEDDARVYKLKEVDLANCAVLPLILSDTFMQRSASPIELHEGGIRRDRTAQFSRLKALKSPRKRSRQSQSPVQDRTESASGELRSIYEEFSRAQSSLASKLAQHNGVRQFGVDFANRVPPLELRMLLPELEVSIVQLLEVLQRLSHKLSALEFPTSSRLHELCCNVEAHVKRTHEEAQATFEQQRAHLQELAMASPLFSPKLSPVLGQRLAAAMRSPPSSPKSGALSPKSAALSEPSTRKPTEELLELELVEHTSDCSDDSSLELCAPVNTWRPFSAVLS